MVVYIKGTTEGGLHNRKAVTLRSKRTLTDCSMRLLSDTILRGWTHVRHVPAGDAWHTASDSLTGAATAYGSPNNAAAAWSKKYDDAPFNEFLFATGDLSLWLQVTKDQAIGEQYDGKGRTIRRSSLSTKASTAIWYNRAAQAADPAISLKNHDDCTGTKGCMLYMEDSNANNVKGMKDHDGADVYIRQVADGNYDETLFTRAKL